MINILKYVLLFFAINLSLISFSQRLNLIINNNKIITKKYLNEEKKNNYLFEYQQKKIHQGYIASCYDSIFHDTITNTTNAYLSTGERYYWNNVKINDDVKYKNNINRSFVKINSIDLLFQNIISIYSNSGYPFVEVKFDSIKINNEKIDAAISINSGNKIHFDTLMVKSEDNIKHYYIEKVLSIKKGDLFSAKKINNINKNIKASVFLEEMRSFDIAFNDSLCDILLYLKKKKASNFSGILGILPNNTTSGKVLLTGDLQLYLLNVLNYGESLSLNWQKYQAESQELNIDFSFPYIFKTNFGIGAQFRLSKLDSLSLSTDISVKILYGNTYGISTYIFYRNISSFLLIDSLANNSDLNLSENRSNLFGINLSYSSLDNVFNPRKGISINFYTANGLKSISNFFNEENPQNTLFNNQSILTIFGHIPIGRYFSIKLKNQTGFMYCEKLYNNELFQIGGINYVRGFDEKSLSASNYSIANFEFRFLFNELSCVYTFYDIAYFETRHTNKFQSNHVMGIGFGVDLSTKLGIFSFAIALGKQNNNNFYLKGYKIHLGYKSYF